MGKAVVIDGISWSGMYDFMLLTLFILIVVYWFIKVAI